MAEMTLPVNPCPGEIRSKYSPRAFDAWHYRTICELCDTIIPPDEECGGANEAGVPELIDLLASENARYQTKITRFVEWLDTTCSVRYGTPYLETVPARQYEALSQIASRKNANGDEALLSGIEGFALLRKLVVGGFFTSRIGIEYLRYIGNDRLLEFPGCPVPDLWFAAEPAVVANRGGANE